MGQRTMTLTTYVDENGKKTNKAYYHQWGIGRKQTNAIIGNFLLMLGNPCFDLSKSNGFHDNTDCFDDINSLDFSKVADVSEIISRCENNNGAVVAIADDNKNTFQIGFLLGKEECGYWSVGEGWVETEKPCSRFVTFDEWAEKVGGEYVNDSYKILFNAFCEHFNARIISGETTAEETTNAQ